MKHPLPLSRILAAAVVVSAGIALLVHRPPGRRLAVVLSASPALSVVRFEENRGQADPEARFIARGGGAPILLGPASLRTGSAGPDGRTVALEMKLVGADPAAEGIGLEPLELKTNYYVGSDPELWRTGIPSFRRVQFDDVYPGINLLYYGASQPGAKLEYDFVVEPGADPDRIELELDGYDEISLDADGALRLRNAAGELHQFPPRIYQPSEDGRREIEGRFVLASAGRVRFDLGDYDRSRTLIIDPEFQYSTFFGGNGDDQAFAIEADSQGNAYITGFSASTDLSTTTGAAQSSLRGPFDVIVAAFDAKGSELLWATYLGGRARDQAWDLAIDSSANTYITGFTDSPDFPTTDGSGPAGGRDSFTSIIGPSGALAFSSRQGGSVDDVGWQVDVATLDQGLFVVTVGGTASRNFPTTPDAFQDAYGGGPSDGFIDLLRFEDGAEFNEPLNRATSFHGGRGFDVADGIAFGNLPINSGLKQEVPFWVSSTTSSDGLFTSDNAPQPERGGGTDGYVTELRIDPTFVDPFGVGPGFGSYVGGSGDERETAIDLFRDGDIITFSVTESNDFPATPGSFMPDNPGGEQSLGITVTQIDPDTGETSRSASYFGGRGFDQGPGLATDPNGSPVISGFTFSTNLPTTPDAPQRRHPGGRFAGYTARFFDDLSDIDFSTYVGGASSNAPNVTVDAFGQIYIAGIGPASWPTTPGSVQEEFGGAPWDATVTKLGGPFLPQFGLVSGGSFRQGPGGGFSWQEIVTQFGTKVGPAEPAGLTIGADGKVTNELGGTRVRVSGLENKNLDILAAILFSSNAQSSFTMPTREQFLEGSGGGSAFLRSQPKEQNVAFATIQFEVDGVLSNVLRVPIADSNPSIFSVDSSGAGQGAILNPDFSVNGTGNPAPSDAFITVYGTGGGAVDPPCPDAGFGPGVEPLPRLTLPQRALIDGIDAEVLYAGSAPGLICGVNQWNIAPTNNPVGDAVSVQVCSGDNCSQEGITAAFR